MAVERTLVADLSFCGGGVMTGVVADPGEAAVVLSQEQNSGGGGRECVERERVERDIDCALTCVSDRTAFIIKYVSGIAVNRSRSGGVS
ncbi:hypothetical protein M6B38_410965 [Iris pallida]|uniref:Uncharacterized protein n=1 Tax=Iris pallida TaxID=29817 RepID=A0AAX6FMG8_IRIPA|nr:hypothetical protein M6B38_410965 [Iris pallida]